MSQKMPWQQLAKYFAGELTEEESQELESWINDDPDRKKEVENLYVIWKESGSLPANPEVDEAWDILSESMDSLDHKAQQADEILSQAESKEKAGQSIAEKSRFRNTHTMIGSIATTAVAALVLIVGLFAYFNNNTAIEKRNTEMPRKKLVTEAGERATYVLKDGSRVILHAGSKLEIPSDYDAENRKVFLKGEAYFEVTSDSAKPFIVHSGQAYTRVLGTKFLVKSWPRVNKNVEVVVAEGKVALGIDSNSSKARKNKLILTRNQKGMLSAGGLSKVTGVNLNWHMGWTKGQLIFKNRPFKKIISRLEHWYALDIQLKEKSIGQKRLTAEINYDQPMSEVLKNIALSLDLEIEKQDRTVTFGLKSTNKKETNHK